jgi:hypothetical protein
MKLIEKIKRIKNYFKSNDRTLLGENRIRLRNYEKKCYYYHKSLLDIKGVLEENGDNINIIQEINEMLEYTFEKSKELTQELYNELHR